ncbi:hypothetical protein D9M68_771130 [compost metagenome]
MHLRHQQLGGLALVELVRALGGNALQGLGQFRLGEGLACLHGAEVVTEVGFAVEQGDGVLAVLELLVGDLEAFLGITDGRGDQLAPGQLAEALVRLPQAHHRAGHAGGLGADQAEVLDDFALVILVHGLAGCLGGDFPVVEEVRLAVHVQGHEAAAADVAGFGVGHGQGEGGGDRGIHRVAAGLEHLGGDLGAVFVRRGDGTAFQRGGEDG